MTVITPRRRVTRIAALAGACALAVAALSGCIKVQADVTVNADATASGTVGFAFQKQAATLMGISDLTTFQSQIKEGDLADSGLGTLDSCEASETDVDFVYSCTFSDQAFTDATGIWSIAKQGDNVVFHMVNEGQTGTEGSDAAALLGDASLGSIDVKVTFPGPITDITGTGATKTSDTTATITGTMMTPYDVTITSESSGGGSSIAQLLVILAAIAVVALIVIVIVVLLVRRRKPPAADAPVDVAGSAAPTGGIVLGDAGAAGAAAVVVSETVTEAPAETVTETVAEAPAEAVTEVTETVADVPAEAVTEVTETVAEAPAEAVTEVTETVAEAPAEAVTEVTETVADATPEDPGTPLP